MSFAKVLREACFSLHLQGETKEAVIEELIDLMVQAGKLNDKKAALDAVMERERKMSTGMQYGIAIPHGKIATVDEMVTAFALKKEGVDFESLDAQPARIFIMTISSTHRTGPHIQYLAEISKLLTRPSVRERLLQAQSVDDILDILSGRPAATP
jgi:PTS system nitrogen regulatory IIA component